MSESTNAIVVACGPGCPSGNVRVDLSDAVADAVNGMSDEDRANHDEVARYCLHEVAVTLGIAALETEARNEVHTVLVECADLNRAVLEALAHSSDNGEEVLKLVSETLGGLHQKLQMLGLPPELRDLISQLMGDAEGGTLAPVTIMGMGPDGPVNLFQGDELPEGLDLFGLPAAPEGDSVDADEDPSQQG